MGSEFEVPVGLNLNQNRIWAAALSIQNGDEKRLVSIAEISSVAKMHPQAIYSILKRFRSSGVRWPFPMPIGGRYPKSDKPKQDPFKVIRRSNREACRSYVKQWKMIKRSSIPFHSSESKILGFQDLRLESEVCLEVDLCV